MANENISVRDRYRYMMQHTLTQIGNDIYRRRIHTKCAVTLLTKRYNLARGRWHNWGSHISIVCVCVSVGCRERFVRVVEPNPKCIDLVVEIYWAGLFGTRRCTALPELPAALKLIEKEERNERWMRRRGRRCGNNYYLQAMCVCVDRCVWLPSHRMMRCLHVLCSCLPYARLVGCNALRELPNCFDMFREQTIFFSEITYGEAPAVFGRALTYFFGRAVHMPKSLCHINGNIRDSMARDGRRWWWLAAFVFRFSTNEFITGFCS